MQKATGLVIRDSHQFAKNLNSQRSHRPSQWASFACDAFDLWSPTIWLSLPAPPDPSPSSQIRTSSQNSVVRAFAPPFANPMFANLRTQESKGFDVGHCKLSIDIEWRRDRLLRFCSGLACSNFASVWKVFMVLRKHPWEARHLFLDTRTTHVGVLPIESSNTVFAHHKEESWIILFRTPK